MNISRIALIISSGPASSFTGHIESLYDGENVSGEGKILVDGKVCDISFQGSASARGTDFYLDELMVKEPLKSDLEKYFIGLLDQVGSRDESNFKAHFQSGSLKNVEEL